MAESFASIDLGGARLLSGFRNARQAAEAAIAEDWTCSICTLAGISKECRVCPSCKSPKDHI